MEPRAFYEEKNLSDPEFPVQLHIDEYSEKCQYFPRHWHEHIELHYVLEGTPLLGVSQREIRAEKGNLVIVNSNELHTGYCDGSLVRVMVIIFEMEAFSKELAGKNIIFQPLIEKDEVIDSIMSVIHREYLEQKIGYRLVCKGEILRLIAHLVREYAEEILTESESDKRKKRLERLNTVLNYIQSNYQEQISNQELADVIHLSEDRFNHLFKESMGMSPLQYMNELRLKKAMSLLKKREYSMSEIADRVGFTDYNHFGRQFRKYYGCAPSEILKGGSGTGNGTLNIDSETNVKGMGSR